MKLLDIIIFVLAFVALIVGIDQVITVGIAQSYWIFMFSLALLFLYRYRKGQHPSDSETRPTKQKKKK